MPHTWASQLLPGGKYQPLAGGLTGNGHGEKTQQVHAAKDRRLATVDGVGGWSVTAL